MRIKDNLIYDHNFKNQRKQNSIVQVLDYVSCLCDNKWFEGIIANANKEEEEDLQVKFMYLYGPSRSFQWLHIADIYWVPNDCISCKTEEEFLSFKQQTIPKP